MMNDYEITHFSDPLAMATVLRLVHQATEMSTVHHLHPICLGTVYSPLTVSVLLQGDTLLHHMMPE
jgi:hypothetical protein